MAHNVLVLSDSILKHCYTPNHADILAVRGATTKTLISRVQQNIINWQNYQLVIIHVGTNDIDDGDGKDVFNNILALCNEIRERQPFMCYIISGILPRPCDFPDSNSEVKFVNYKLRNFCYRRPNFHFNQTYNSFLKNGFPDLAGDYWGADELHLNDRGIKRMNAILKNLVARWRNGTL